MGTRLLAKQAIFGATMLMAMGIVPNLISDVVADADPETGPRVVSGARSWLGTKVALARPNRAAARRAYRVGRRQFKRGHYKAAARSFQRAFRLHPRYMTLCEIARCHRRLGNLTQASRYLRRCLAAGAAKSRSANRIKRSLADIEAQLGQVTVKSVGDKPATVVIDGETIEPAPAVLLVTPGEHRIEVHRDGSAPAVTTVRVAASERTQAVLGTHPVPSAPSTTDEAGETERPTSQPAPRRKQRLAVGWFAASASLTVAAGIATAILGALAITADQDFNREPTPFGHDRVRQRKLATYIALGATAAFAASTTTLFFFTDLSPRKSKSNQKKVAYGIGIRGRF